MGETSECLRSLYAVSNSSVFRACRKLLKDSADLQSYSCTTEFHTDGTLALKAFADNASVIRGADSKVSK